MLRFIAPILLFFRLFKQLLPNFSCSLIYRVRWIQPFYNFDRFFFVQFCTFLGLPRLLLTVGDISSVCIFRGRPRFLLTAGSVSAFTFRGRPRFFLTGGSMCTFLGRPTFFLGGLGGSGGGRPEEHTSELQSHSDLVCRLLLEKKQNF